MWFQPTIRKLTGYPITLIIFDTNGKNYSYCTLIHSMGNAKCKEKKHNVIDCHTTCLLYFKLLVGWWGLDSLYRRLAVFYKVLNEIR